MPNRGRCADPRGWFTWRLAVGQTLAVAIALGALVAAPVPGAAAPTPTAAAAASGIRPAELPARADALLHRLAAAQPGAAAAATLAAIEQELPAIGRRLDAGIARAMDALQRAASLEEIEDVRREIMSDAAPLDDWKRELAAEAQRRANALDAIARETLVWSQTRDRAETAAAGPVVAQRVQSVLQALDDAFARLDQWRARVIDLSERVIDRAATVEAVTARLEQAAAADRATLEFPERPPLWSRGLGRAVWHELPHLPDALRANAGATLAYAARNARALLAQAVVALLLMFALGRLASRARARLGDDPAGARAIRLLERPYATALLLALLATPAFHPLAPRRFLQLAAALAILPAARVINHVSRRAYLPLRADCWRCSSLTGSTWRWPGCPRSSGQPSS